MTGRSWAYLGAVLGATVSVSANVAHSFVPPPDTPSGWTPQPGAVALSVFWPVALLVALEILARVEWPDRGLWVAVRWLGLTPVGFVAGLVSYRHLSALLAWYGEDSVTSLIGPLAVDGLMLISSGALLAGRSQTAVSLTQALVPTLEVSTETIAEPLTDACSDTRTDAPSASVEPRTGPLEMSTGTSTETRTQPRTGPLDQALEVRAEVDAEPRTETRTQPRTDARTDDDKPARQRPVSGARTRVLRLHARHPEMSATTLAERVGKSPSTVRRYLADATPVQAPGTRTDDAVGASADARDPAVV